MKAKDELEKLGACREAIEWVDERTLDEAWAVCERGDWMLWLLGWLADTEEKRKPLVLAACDCAELALKYVPAGELRPAEALRVARAWALGDGVALDDVRRAAYATYAAYTAYAAAAAYAAYAAAAAAYAATAAYAAAAATAAAATAAYTAARTATLKACADIVRRHYPAAPKLNAHEKANSSE